MYESEKCLLCDLPVAENYPTGVGMETWYKCLRCGTYRLDNRIGIETPAGFNRSLRARLSGVVRAYVDSEGKPYPECISLESFERLANSSGAPRTPEGQANKLIIAIAERSEYLGDWTPMASLDVWAARAFLPSAQELLALVKFLKESNLITWSRGDVDARFQLTMAGWEQYYSLTARVGAGDQCFVAMWYEPTLLKIYEDHVLPGIKGTGFNPYLVARDIHQDRIDNRIIAEIRKSRFMLADLTGSRGGVYYEAGYAQGLDLPVIWSCNSTWKTNTMKRGELDCDPPNDGKCEAESKQWFQLVHFDINHFPFNLWESGAEWREKVVAWIEANKHRLSGTMVD